MTKEDLLGAYGAIIFRNGVDLKSDLTTKGFYEPTYRDNIVERKIVKLFNNEVWLLTVDLTFKRNAFSYDSARITHMLNLTESFNDATKHEWRSLE